MRSLLLTTALGCTGPAPGKGGDSADGAVDVTVDWTDRFVDSAQTRGVDITLEPYGDAPPYMGNLTGVVAEDLDQDADIDLLFFDGAGGLHLLENDGSGRFATVAAPAQPHLDVDRLARSIGAGDLDGDGLHELVAVGDGFIAVSRNAGGLSFGAFEDVVYDDGPALAGYATLAFGDIDSDGDLDVSVGAMDVLDPATGLLPDPDDAVPTPDVLLFNTGGTLGAPVAMTSPGGDGLSMTHVFTDRDQDGDLDLLAWPDRSGGSRLPAVFWRNDGGTAPNVDLVDDAADVGADTIASAMGHASADLNGDGLPDYCVSDTADVLTCLVSDGGGRYFDGAAALGLRVDREAHPAYPGPEDSFVPTWISWGVVIVDLDNDGALDAAASAAQLPNPWGMSPTPSPLFQPHWLWKGQDDGTFATRLDAGVLETRHSWALVSADLDGDGARELISPTAGRPTIWDNPATPGHWVEIVLDGPGGNVHGVGATVVLEAGGQTWLQEVPSMTASGQSPAALHFGLGAATGIDRVEVRWPGGGTTVFDDVAVDQRVVLAVD